MAQWHKRVRSRRLWVRFPLREMDYLIFSFPRSGNEVKRGVEYRDNAPRIRQKVGNTQYVMSRIRAEDAVTMLSQITLLYAGKTMKLRQQNIYIKNANYIKHLTVSHINYMKLTISACFYYIAVVSRSKLLKLPKSLLIKREFVSIISKTYLGYYGNRARLIE